VVGLGQKRVEGHHRAGQVQRVQQRPERGDLVALDVDLTLGQHDAVVTQSGDQVDAAAVGANRSAQGLAVHRNRSPHRAGRRVSVLAGGAGGGGTIGEPAADRRVERVAVDVLQHPAHGRLAGRSAGPVRITQSSTTAEQQPVRGISGPLGDRGERLRSGQDRAGGDRQDIRQWVTAAPAAARVGHAGQPGQKVGQFVGAGRITTRELAQPDGDG
jgi:hypothetical protein